MSYDIHIDAMTQQELRRLHDVQTQCINQIQAMCRAYQRANKAEGTFQLADDFSRLIKIMPDKPPEE